MIVILCREAIFTVTIGIRWIWNLTSLLKLLTYALFNVLNTDINVTSHVIAVFFFIGTVLISYSNLPLPQENGGMMQIGCDINMSNDRTYF